MGRVLGEIRLGFPARRGGRGRAAAATHGKGRPRLARAVRPFALLAGAWAAAPAHAQCQYEVVAVLHYPINCGIGQLFTTGRAMNRRGTVVGSYCCPLWEYDESFLWTAEGGFTTLQRPPGVVSAIAEDINDDGVICGTMVVNGFGDRGFVYENGVWTQLPPGIPDSGMSKAVGISNSCVAVGQRQVAGANGPFNVYAWSPSLGFLDLVASGPEDFARDISKGGLVLGWTGENWLNGQGFLWNDGAVTYLGPVPGGSNSEPYAVNEEGAIVGAGMIPMPGYTYGVPRAFLWIDGTFTMLGTLPGYAPSQAYGINALGQVVGRSGNANVSEAFIWQNGSITNLNDLVPPGLGTLRMAGRVADDGTIMAYRSTETLMLKPVNVPIGDLDLDCRVAILDFLNLLEHWGPCPETVGCRADLDGDGLVGFADFAMLLASWG